MYNLSTKDLTRPVIKYFKSIPTLRVTPSITPGYLAPRLPTTAPETPQPFTQILSDVNEHIIPGLTHWQHPRFFAFFPASVSFPSILGELFSAAFTAPAFNWLCSPACTELETVVLDWVARLFGLPELFLSTSGRGGGVIQGSASEAVVVAMVAARERAVRSALTERGISATEQPGESAEEARAREDASAEIRARLVALGSEQAHSATHKAANILGMRYRTVRAGAASGFRMTAASVEARIAELRAQGLEPFYITASFGTTATCAVDEIGAIVQTVRRVAPGLWVHVDAAYAGGAWILPEVREKFGTHDALAGVDSIDVNMHKWLLVNFDASVMYVRDRRDLVTALSVSPSYLINPTQLAGLVTDYRDWQIPLGRRFRALKIWFVLRSYGAEKMREVVRGHISLGELFAGLCRSEKGRQAGIEVVTGPAFALTVIRVLEKAPDMGAAQVVTNGNRPDEINSFGQDPPPPTTASNELTKRVYELVNARGEFFLTSGVVDGVYAIRVVSANEAAHEKYVRRCFDVIVEAIEDVRAGKDKP